MGLETHPKMGVETQRSTSRVKGVRTMLKNKGQPRSGETGIFFMPPRRARAGRATEGWREAPSVGGMQSFPKARRVI